MDIGSIRPGLSHRLKLAQGLPEAAVTIQSQTSLPRLLDGRVLGFGGKEAVLRSGAEGAPADGTTREGRKVVAIPRKEMEQAG